MCLGMVTIIRPPHSLVDISHQATDGKVMTCIILPLIDLPWCSTKGKNYEPVSILICHTCQMDGFCHRFLTHLWTKLERNKHFVCWEEILDLDVTETDGKNGAASFYIFVEYTWFILFFSAFVLLLHFICTAQNHKYCQRRFYILHKIWCPKDKESQWGQGVIRQTSNKEKQDDI